MSTVVNFDLVDVGLSVSQKVWAVTFDGISITADEVRFDAIRDTDYSLEECLTLKCITCHRRAYTTVIVRNIRLEDESEELEAFGTCFNCENSANLYPESESDESQEEGSDVLEVNAVLELLARLVIPAPELSLPRSEINLSGPEDSDSSTDL